MSLGIFNRLWSLLEDACIELDFLSGCSGNDFTLQASTFQRRSLLKMELECQRNFEKLMNQMLTYAILTIPDEESEVIKDLKKEVAAIHSKVDAMVIITSQIRNAISVYV